MNFSLFTKLNLSASYMSGGRLNASGRDGLVSGPTFIVPENKIEPESGSSKSQDPNSLNVNVNVSPGRISPLSKLPS